LSAYARGEIVARASGQDGRRECGANAIVFFNEVDARARSLLEENVI